MGVEYACPSCEGVVSDPAGDGFGGMVCTRCGAVFSVPEEEEEVREVVGEGGQLSAARVRALSARKRSLIRTRTYVVVGMVVCAVAGVALVIKGGQGVAAMGTVGLRQMALAGAGLLCLAGARYFLGLAGRYAAEIDATALAEPTTPPNFSGLSNGEQRWTNLERVE